MKMSRRQWKNHIWRVSRVPVYDEGDEKAGMTEQAWRDKGYAVKADAEGWLTKGRPEDDRIFLAREVEGFQKPLSRA